MPRRTIKHKYHYLYKTTNLINNKYYYGMHSTCNLHDGYLGSGTRLLRAIKKHDKENFKIEILEFFNSREELINGEIKLITELIINEDLCMNLKPGGQGGFNNVDHQLKCSKAGNIGYKLKFDNDPIFANKISITRSNAMKTLHKANKLKHNTFEGKTHKEETKNKMSEKAKLRTGDKNSSFGTCWITKEGINKKIKKEELNTYLISNWTKGRK